MSRTEKKGLKEHSKTSKMVNKLNSTIQNLHNLKVNNVIFINIANTIIEQRK